MVSFFRVAGSALYVPGGFERAPHLARLGLLADDASASTISWPEAQSRTIVVFWPERVDWSQLLSGLEDLQDALPGGAVRFAWLNLEGGRSQDFAVPVSGRLAEPFRLDWVATTMATTLAAATLVEASDTGVVFRPAAAPHVVTFPEELPAPGSAPRPWRLEIAGPISVSFVDPAPGCLRFDLAVDERQLEALGAQIRFFAAGALQIDDEEFELAPVTDTRFPLLHLQESDGAVLLEATIDPMDPLDMERSAFALPASRVVYSHFETVLGHAVALRPLDGARFVLDRSLSAIDRQARPLLERTYLTPAGPFELVVDESEGEDWPERHSLVLGTSTSEYVTFRPRRGDAPGDRIVFHPRRPATDRASLPPGASGAGLAGPAGAEILLADVATTSWISFAPGSPGLVDAGPTLVSQPAELELFADAPSAGLVATPRTMLFDPRPRADAAREPMPIAPFLGVASLTGGVSVDVEAARATEGQLVALARQEQTRHRGAGAAGLAPEERATPHGFPVTLEGDRWRRVVLGKTPPGMPDFGLDDMEEPATRALSGNRTFLVATRLGPGLAKLADKLEIAGWRFLSDIDQRGRNGGQSSEPKNAQDILPTFVFKYHDRSVFDLLGLDARTGLTRADHQDQDNWTAAEDFNADWKAIRQQLRLYLRNTVERHEALGGQSPYGLFLDRLRDPAWNGLLMLNSAIEPAGLPTQVQGLLAGIDTTYFRGHHVGLDLNQLGQQGFDIEHSAFFGVVDYPQPEIPNPQPFDPEHEPPDELPDGWSRVDEVEGEGRIANFRVEYLRVQFENSEVRRFDCRVNLWLATLFRDPLPGLPSSGDEPIITFDGKYERRRDSSGTVTETYTFAHESDYEFVVDTAMIDRLTISRLQMTTVEADDRRVLSRFSFWGDLTFQAVGDFDLFGINRIKFGDLGIELDFDLAARIKRFLPRLGSLRFDLSSGSRRKGSFFGQLPFRLKFFQFGDGLSLDKLGYFKFDTPNFGADLFDFALGFDLDLGSLGALAKKLEGLRLETLFGWLPASAGGGFAIGFKLRGTGGGALDLGIEGVLRLVIEKLKIEDFEYGGTKHFAIQAVNTRLEVLGLSFPGEESQLKLFLFVDPKRLAGGSVSEMAWLGVLTDSSGGDGFQLPLLALGQRVDAFPEPGDVPTTRQVTDHIASLGRIDHGGELVSILNSGQLQYAPEREWTVALRAILWDLAAVDLVFLDPDLYGIRLRVPGPAEQQQLFAVDVLYRKVTDDLGVYSIELAVPDAWRQLEFGYFSLTLPVIGFDFYSNGDFLIDIGFPWGMDFSRSCTVQALPFLGGGGFYYAQLEAAGSSLVPVPKNPRFTYDPVVQLGFGARIGLGKEFRKGVLRAGLSVSFFGILEGVWGELRELRPPADDEDPLLPTDYPGHYLVVAGTAGILGEVFGHVDFGIVKAGVSIRVWIAFGWVLETYQPLLLSVEAGVQVRVKVVIGRIKIFGRTIKITISFSFSARLRFEWTLGKGEIERWNRLFLPQGAGLAAPALQPDLGPARCLDWIDVPVVFDLPREIPLRFAPDVTLVDGVPHTVSLLTIEPERLRLLGRALVLWAGARWAADAPLPTAGEQPAFNGPPAARPFSVHDLRHLEACLACPRSLARGDSQPGGDTFTPLDATALRKLFDKNLRFRVLAAEEVPDEEEGLQAAVFPFLSHLALSYRRDGGDAEMVKLSERRATRAYLDRLDAGFEKLRILLEQRQPSAGLADEAAAPFADFLLEDYCHLLLRQTVEALEGLLAGMDENDDPRRVGASAPLATLLDRLDELDDDEAALAGWRQIGESTSRFYLHGLRVPSLDETGGELALFEAIGVQRQIPAGGQRYRVSVEQSEPVDWLNVDVDVGESIEMVELARLPATVPVTLRHLEVRSPIRPRARRYPLQARAAWAHGAERRTLWNLPPALKSDLRQQTRGLRVFEERPGILDGQREDSPLPARWATRLSLRVQRLVAQEGSGAVDRPVYQLLPLGEAERRRLDRLVDAPEWLGQTEPRLVFRSGDGSSDAVSHRRTRATLWRTDLSTEPAPVGAGLTGTASDDLLVRAELNEVLPFITLLRRASLVRSAGYFFAYRGGDADLKPGLPAQIFDAEGRGELSLLLLHPVAAPDEPVSAFADAVVLGPGVGDRGHGGGDDASNDVAGADRTIVYARASSPSLESDFDFDLPFAPGTVGFRAYREHPKSLPIEAEQAVAEQYHLLEYEIFETTELDGKTVPGDRLHTLSEVLPVAPQEIGEDRRGEEPRERPGDLAAEDWCYEHIVPAHKLLHGPHASPYSAVGETLRVALRFRDPYGNRLADDPEMIDLDVRYTDRLLSPTDWPSMVSTWDVAADRPGRIRVQLRFDARGFYADRSAPDPVDWTWIDPTREDEEGRAAVERIADVRRCYATVRQQLEDPRTTMRLSASFHVGSDLALDAADRRSLIALVDEILDFLAGLPDTGRALPNDQSVEPVGRRWTKDFELTPRSDDFEQLLVSFHIERPGELVDDRIAGKVPEVTAAVGPIEAAMVATSATGEADRGAGLVAFAERFEAVFPTLAMAVGTGSDQRRALWAIRRSLISIDFTGEEPAYFALPPMSTRLASGQVVVPDHPDVGLSGGAIRVTDVDLDVQLRETFADIERFLRPELADRVLELDATAGSAVDRVIRAKDAAAALLAPKLQPVFRDPPEIDDRRAVDLLKERMRTDLREGYDVDTLVVVPMRVAEGNTAGAPPVAYGRLVDAPSTLGDDPPPESRRLSAANLTLAGGGARTYLVFALDSKREIRQELEALRGVTYRPTHVERRIDDAPEDRNTAWLQLVRADSFAKELPAIDVPVPLRRFPDLPRLEQHGGSGDPITPGDFATRLAATRRWRYEVSFDHPFVDQDTAYLNVLYNIAQQPSAGGGALAAPASAEASDPLEALAAYHHHRGELWRHFDALHAGEPAGEIARLVAIYVDLVEAVVRSLRPAARLGDDLVRHREEYRIDDDLLDSGLPDGRRRLELERIVDVFGGGFEVLPRRADGEPYDVREEPGSPGVDHRVISYQPEPGESRFRPLARLSRLDVLLAESAWAGLLLRRNENFGTRPAAESFVYETPAIRFGESFTPTLDHHEPLVVDGPAKTLRIHVEMIFGILGAGVIPEPGEEALKRPLRVDMRWSYESGVLAGALGEPPLMVRPPHPIAIFPAYDLASHGDVVALASAVAGALDAWRSRHRPVAGAHLLADVRVYGRNVEKPVLRLRRVAIPIEKIAGG